MQPERPTDLGEHRQWLGSLVPIPAAGVWADIGCGGGDDLLLVAGQQPSLYLRLVGLDSNAESIEAAKRRVGANDSRVHFLVHKLEIELPFEAESLDVVYANNLLECLTDRTASTREIARVLKPGGWVVVPHWDWDSQIFDSIDKNLVRRLVAAFADWQQPWMDQCDGWMGRRLWGAFQPSGLFEGTVEARVMINTEYAAPWYGHARAHDFGALVRRGLASQEDYERFLREQDALSELGHYFYSITGFAYVGQQMTDEMQLRGLSSRTQQSYLNAVCSQCKTSSLARCRRATVIVCPQAHGANRMVYREVLVIRCFRL